MRVRLRRLTVRLARALHLGLEHSWLAPALRPGAVQRIKSQVTCMPTARVLAVPEPELSPGLPMPLRCLWRHDDGHNVEVMPVALGKPPFSTGPAGGQAPGGSAVFTCGRIGGQPVPCLSAGLQLALHDGYPLRPVDATDLGVLRAYLREPGGTVAG